MGFLSAEEVEDARQQLPEAVFRELYLAEPSDDAGNPFGLKAIRDGIAPLSHELPVAWGWDLEKSVDWTVGIGLVVPPTPLCPTSRPHVLDERRVRGRVDSDSPLH